MSYEVVASGGLADLIRLKDYEFAFDENQRGLLQLDLRTSVPASIAKELETQLKQKGVKDARVTTGSPKLNIYFRKGFPWLAVIALTILALAALAVMIVGWRLFKEIVPAGLQSAVGTFGLLVVLLVMASLAFRGFKT